jgi:hypothetical protein
LVGWARSIFAIYPAVLRKPQIKVKQTLNFVRLASVHMPDNIDTELHTSGFAIRSGTAMQEWLGCPWKDWSGFAASWNDLGEDCNMADGGRYRRRRYAVFQITGGQISRAPHQPHYQAKTYNRLNGGLERWFEPVLPEVGQHPIIRLLIGRLASTFGGLLPQNDTTRAWHAEMHQFRIEARAGLPGLPTPEGIHRDGVDGAFVMLIQRDNVDSGVTQIFDPQGRPLGSFTLADPGDAVFLDDRRVFHGVTPIQPLDPARPAIRDVLVITFSHAV